MATTQAIDLIPFCRPPDEDVGKYHIRDPFVLAGWRFACDGGIAARVAAPGEPDTKAPGEEARSGQLPTKIVELFGSVDLQGEPEELPPVPVRDKDSDIWWRKPVDCLDCCGIGRCRCSCGELCHDCHECGGTGKVLEVAWSESVEIGGRKFAEHYLARIAALPNAKLWPEATCDDPNALVFTFDGGCGLLMPVKRN